VELAHQVLAVNMLGRPESGTTVTPTVVAAGSTTNTVPGAAVLHIDGRATEMAEQERVDAAIRRLTPALPGAELRIEGGSTGPLWTQNPPHRWCRSPLRSRPDSGWAS